MRRLRRMVDWFIPEQLRSGGALTLWRARFLVHVLVGGSSASAVMALAYVELAPAMVLPTLLITVFLSALLLCLRLGVPWAGIVHVGLGGVLTLMAYTSLLETRLEGSTAAWCCIIPPMAVLLLGSRRAVVWGPLTALTVVGLYLLHRGAGQDSDGPIHLVRALALMGTLLGFAWSFDAGQSSARRHLEEASAAKSRFLATMSHELRTPMNGVLGMVEVLLQRRDLPREVVEDLHTIRHSGHAMVSLVGSVLDMAKVEAGKLKLDPSPLSLGVLLDELGSMYRHLADARGLTFDVRRGAGVPDRVVGDELRLRQVLSNLLDNALKFTAHGSVALEVAQAHAGLRFTVRDTGPGIPPELADRLFQPFEQADASTSRRFGGSGLGLALCAQLVRLMGGRLELAPSPAGAAFTFAVALPEAPPRVVADADRPEPVASSGRVLVVDDNPINLKVASALVRSSGFEVSEATDGRTAVELASDGPWAAILMDCHMPLMDGFEAAQTIRSLDGDRGLVPIIALTASVMPEDIARCRAAGMDDVLTKPVRVDALRDALVRAMSRERVT